MDNTKLALKGWMQSSVDPSKLSLTIESAGKSLAGIVALVAAVQGLDPQAATSMWMAIVGQATIAVTAIYTCFHVLQGLYGAVRKLIVFFGVVR